MTHSIVLTAEPYSHKAPSAEEMADFDRVTIKNGIKGLELMERAGEAMFREIKRRLLSDKNAGGSITILCGTGNNGGDGLVVARLLQESGKAPSVVCLHSERYSVENLEQAARFLAAGGAISVLGGSGGYGKKGVSEITESALARLLADSRLIVDALVGTGQNKAPKGAAAAALSSAAENGGAAMRVALDVPSGTSATTGEVFRPYFQAGTTLTVELVKRGMLQYPAREAGGDIVALSIGIDCAGKSQFSIFDGRNYESTLARGSAAHKGDFGRVLVIGGSAAYQGAPVLAAHGAVRSGAGLVTLAALPAKKSSKVFPEIMHVAFTGKARAFGKAHLKTLTPHLQTADALVIGPGLGREKSTKAFLADLLSRCVKGSLRTVLDADGLNLLSGFKSKFRRKLKSFVLTPHPGEAARLLGISTAEVQRDRYGAAVKIGDFFSCCVVLKGAASIVYCGDAGIINLSGNPFMASGGSGDVLSGVIAALLAQKLSVSDAAALGCNVHGVAGDIVVGERRAAVLASDLVAALPRALETYTREPVRR